MPFSFIDGLWLYMRQPYSSGSEMFLGRGGLFSRADCLPLDLATAEVVAPLGMMTGSGEAGAESSSAGAPSM